MGGAAVLSLQALCGSVCSVSGTGCVVDATMLANTALSMSLRGTMEQTTSGIYIP